VTRGDEQRIADILDAAQKLSDRLNMPFETWADNEDLRLVTERLVEIIGEAARAMTDAARDGWPTIDWTGLIGLRNVLVHAYHRIQPELLWRAATVDIPAVAGALSQTPSTKQRTQNLSIPDADVAAVENYCAERIPSQYLDEVRVECTRRGNNLTIFETRAPLQPEQRRDWTRQPVAQLRYDPSSRHWTLYCADRNGRWHRYTHSQPSQTIRTLLRDITADPTGIFWG
jgi:uncharacterized protein with HEPN domain